VKDARTVIEALRARHLKLATAESCTGGLVAAAITDIAGSSDVFDRGFVTYSNEAKTEMLGVPSDLIAKHGAVSREVAEAMALGALAHSRADIAISVTGIAGPLGGSSEKPVGLVHFACARRGQLVAAIMKEFPASSREAVRTAARDRALELIWNETQ
jgi:nicotinamide-nucleotide amidase